MLGLVAIWLTNARRALGNGWRALLRRRVDWVRIELRGSLPEFAPAPTWWARRFLGARPPLDLMGLRRLLDRVAADPQTRGVLLVIDGLAAGWATLQSLRDELNHLRAAGRRVAVFLVTPDARGYYTACAADLIAVPPAAYLSVTGVYTEVQFLRDALARIGVSAEVTAVSPYKTAGDRFARADISPEDREQLERLVEGRYTTLLRGIAAGRGLSEDQVRALIDAAPLSAERARDAGLIDAVLYEDELAGWLAGATAAPQAQERRGPPTITAWPQAHAALRLPYLRRHRRMVGVVAIEGTITTGASRSVPLPLPFFGGSQAGSDSVTQALRRAERDRRLAALVLYVNSPGGSAFASDLIWREVERIGRTRPVVVAMGDVAASGGYYVAAPARAIVAQPGTVTGSIGVLVVRPVVSELLERVGVNTVAIGRGANASFFAGSGPPSEREREATRELVFDMYADFKARVQRGRRLDEAALEPLAGGRVWSGAEAQARGLVDALGGLPEALRRAQELAGLPQDRAAPLMLVSAGRGRLPPQPYRADPAAALEALLTLLRRPEVWALAPFIEV